MQTSIGERIRTRRKQLNITQTQIQKEIGISSGNLSSIETGRSLPSAAALIGLAKILSCTTDWILTGFSSCSKNNSLLSEEDQAWLDLLHEVPLEKRSTCFTYMQGYIAGLKSSELDEKRAVGK